MPGNGGRNSTKLLAFALVFLLAGIAIAIAPSLLACSGAATLPGGVPLAINTGMGGFSVSESAEQTVVTLGDQTLTFTASEVSQDDQVIHAFATAPTSVILTETRGEIELVADGEKVVLTAGH